MVEKFYICAALYTLLGLLIGSFLNVVIHRLPIMIFKEYQAEADELDSLKLDLPKGSYNLMYPASSCPNCNNSIHPLHNIPVFSYLFLLGKCSYCKTSIAFRYPFVEILTAFLSLMVFIKFGLSMQAVVSTILVFSLVVITFIDIDYKIIPNNISLPLLWLGLIANNYMMFTTLEDALFGAIFGYIILWSTYWFYKLCTGKEGMGHGDFKLLAMFGAFFGYQAILPILLTSSISALIISFSLIAMRRLRISQAFAYGPYICFAGILYLFFADSFFRLHYKLILLLGV